MHVQGTPVLNCPAREAVIYPTTPGGPLWYFPEDEGGVRLSMTVDLSLDMMATALYGLENHVRYARDLATAEDVRGCVAIAVLSDGLIELERRADELARPGARVERSEWLAFCFQRATGVMAGAA
jgi:hypothetical protein